jgi:hypothetical protein
MREVLKKNVEGVMRKCGVRVYVESLTSAESFQPSAKVFHAVRLISTRPIRARGDAVRQGRHVPRSADALFRARVESKTDFSSCDYAPCCSILEEGGDYSRGSGRPFPRAF